MHLYKKLDLFIVIIVVKMVSFLLTNPCGSIYQHIYIDKAMPLSFYIHKENNIEETKKIISILYLTHKILTDTKRIFYNFKPKSIF